MQAEQRLAARRAAREEARMIRMKELERQQREMEEKQDRLYELTRETGVSHPAPPSPNEKHFFPSPSRPPCVKSALYKVTRDSNYKN